MEFKFPIHIKYKKQYFALMEALENEGYHWLDGSAPTQFKPIHFNIAVNSYDKALGYHEWGPWDED